MHIDTIYSKMLTDIIHCGENRPDRTRTGTTSIFGYQYRYNLAEGFPLLTTKKVHFKSVAEELLWILRGDTNSKSLEDIGVTIWKEWAAEDGSLGPVYGAAARRWIGRNGNVIDQLEELIDELRNRPFSRRHILSMWNPDTLPDESISPQANVKNGNAALACCHTLYQFYVHVDGRLSLHMTQRSADVFLGVPFNIASIALFVHILAHKLCLTPGDLIHSFGDLHLYANHRQQAEELLDRTSRTAPELKVTCRIDTPIEQISFKDFELLEYNPHPPIKAPIAI